MSTDVRVFENLSGIAAFGRPVHLAVGMFDGVHRGHRAVLEAALRGAASSDGVSGALTFWPHPSRLLRPDKPERMILDLESRRRVLAQTGISFIVEQNFDREFAAIEADQFVPFVKRWIPRLATIYVGENWHFGRGRKGDVTLLTRLARAEAVDVVRIERLQHHGEPISSTRIRELVARGEMGEVYELLGFPYFATGIVVPGQRLGRTIGFPTLNLAWEPDLRPALGVYAVRVGPADGEARQLGVANYGVRPTVDGTGAPVLEVHVMAACPYHAGDRLLVELLRHLRPERKFSSVGDLRAQIVRDRDAARSYFSELSASPTLRQS